jgi:hypothetical protein
MNRFTKYAVNKLENEVSDERDKFVRRAFKSKEFHNSQNKQKRGLSKDQVEQNSICYAIKHTMELATINGNKKCYGDYGIDRLAVGDFQLPIPEFYYCTSWQCYRPGCTTHQLNQIIGRYHYKAYKKEVVKKWALVKDFLLQPSYKSRSSLMKPVLIIEKGDHVYFMHDEVSGDVKIGVSNQVITRFQTLNKFMKNNDLQIVKVIDLGGYELEAALHKFFGAHRIWPREEWFVFHDDIHDFIAKLDAGEDPWDLINASSKVELEDEQEVA